MTEIEYEDEKVTVVIPGDLVKDTCDNRAKGLYVYGGLTQLITDALPASAPRIKQPPIETGSRWVVRRTSDIGALIAVAASNGMVTLVVEAHGGHWGRFTPDELHQEYRPEGDTP